MKLYDGREFYQINAAGEMARQNAPERFSGQWRLLGMVRRNNFGHIVETVGFPQCAQITDWHYKNGRMKWHPMDYDHGTRRLWGNAAKIIK